MTNYKDMHNICTRDNPEIGDFLFQPFFGSILYFGRDNKWHDNLILENNGDEFEIVRLEVVPNPDTFKLEVQ